MEIIISLSDLVTLARCLQNLAALYRIAKKAMGWLIQLKVNSYSLGTDSMWEEVVLFPL